MRRAYNVKNLGNWESFKEESRKEGQLCGWTVDRLQEAFDNVPLVYKHCAGYFENEHGLFETDHRSSRRNGRSCLVVRLPALQLLHSG